jgi:DNA polymerase III sliding clamp (beta) subunit (PCNA family)
MKTKELKTILTNTVYAVSSEPYRIALTGLLFDLDNQFIIATDGHRIVRCPIDIHGKGQHLLADPKAFKSAVNKIKSEYVELEFEDDTINIITIDGDYSFAKLKEKYPDWKRVYPSYELGFSLDRAELMDVLKTMTAAKPYSYKVILDMKGGICRMICNKDNITITAGLRTQGFRFKIAFSAYSLYEIVKTLNTELVKIEYKDHMSSVIINDNVVLMPLKMED